MSDASKDYPAITKRILGGMKAIRGHAPETMKGFNAMAGAAMQDGALDAKTKEFMALAIAIATRCDGCIGFHMKALIDLGATEAEVADALGMTVYMGGGPSLMYAADAWAAYEQFRDAAAAKAG